MEHTGIISQHQSLFRHLEINRLNMRMLLPRIKLHCFRHVHKIMIQEI